MAIQRKHMRVVGCVPVPKARPGSSLTLTACGSGKERQLGTINLGLTHNLGGAPFNSVAAVSILGRLGD